MIRDRMLKCIWDELANSMSALSPTNIQNHLCDYCMLFEKCDYVHIPVGVCQPTCRFSGVKVSRALPSFSGLSHTVCASSRFLTARPFHLSGCFLFASSRTSFLALRIAADSPR